MIETASHKSTIFARFWHAEDGAVTVDWVIIAAAVVGLAIAMVNSIGNATVDHAKRVETTFISNGIMTY